MNKWAKWADWIFLILYLSILINSGSARMGYDIYFSVDGFGRHISRSTQEMNFSVDGVIIGVGKFQRYSNIDGFAGVNAKDCTSSPQPGSLKYAEKISLKAREGPVNIRVKLNSQTNESENNSEIIIDGNGDVTVDEHWPTHLFNQKKIEYFGPGLRSIEYYDNNGDIVSTYLDSWKLTRDTVYVGFINRSLYDIKVDAPSFKERHSKNQTAIYLSEMSSISSANRLGVFAPGEGNSPDVHIDQSYVGDQKMKLKIIMGDQTIIPEEAETSLMLECCFISQNVNGGKVYDLQKIPINQDP